MLTFNPNRAHARAQACAAHRAEMARDEFTPAEALVAAQRCRQAAWLAWQVAPCDLSLGAYQFACANLDAAERAARAERDSGYAAIERELDGKLK